MKRVFAMMLAIVLILTMASSVMATVPQNTTHDVNANYQKDQTKKVYSVDITWGSMQFTYTEGNKGTWNTTTHKYDAPGKVESGWVCDTGANVITVTNHSNVDITATAAFEKDAGAVAALTDVTETIDNNGVVVQSAEAGAAQKGQMTITFKGAPASDFGQAKKLGVVTITIK